MAYKTNTSSQENTTWNFTAQNALEIVMAIPVPVLAKELETYKISHYILTYLAIPVAVWGCFGNFFSFRFVYYCMGKSTEEIHSLNSFVISMLQACFYPVEFIVTYINLYPGTNSPCRRFKSFRQNSDIQIILIGVLAWVSMRNFFLLF